MTELFECNGCGAHLPKKQIYANLFPKDELVDALSEDLCRDCYAATKQFLKERYNNVKKGQNTGLSLSGINWSNTSGMSTYNSYPFVYPEPITNKKKPTKKNSNNKKVNNKRK